MAFPKTLVFSGLLALSQLLQVVDGISLSVSKDGGNASSPILYGFMFEDINHSGDGGIHAQLLRNNGFQGDNPGLTAYGPVGNVYLTVDTDNPLSTAITSSLKVSVPSGTTGKVGFLNEGYWGIPVTGDTYSNYFWMKGDYKGTVTLQLVGVSSGTVYASKDLEVASTADNWTYYETSYGTTAAPDGNNVWQLLFDASEVAGSALYFDLVQLFPPTFHDRPNGLRPTIANALVDVQGSFLRFPGGNNLEGYSPADRWIWNNTIGPLESRPGRQGAWTYPNTDALGLLEYLLWCEDMNLVPVLGVFDGLDLSGGVITGPELEPYIQQALDEIEYVRGSIDTPNGALRAKDGHPEPFKLTHVEIGNEDDLWGGCSSYPERFTAFYNAIHPAYPDINIIASTRNDSCLPSPRLDGMWMDQHHYLSPDEFVASFDEFDHVDRNHPIFVGEYAVTSTNNGADMSFPNIIGSVAEAVYMIGLERNSDVVLMAAYAPLLQHFNSTQWIPDLIGYDSDPGSLTLSTSYYVQKIFSNNRGDTILPVKSDSDFGPVYWVASVRDTTHFIKLANYGSSSQTVDITIDGTTTGTVTILSGAENESNYPYEANVVPVESTVSASKGTFTLKLPAWSVAVLKAN
ncbi:hypothetical protein VTN00DRAFT_6633 [Thermoascus crustaceus]|uniref:uncharacterized protein n=1 Tax=Thermoascus crustaceus TaxID=5088 RepID=UPI00085D6A92